MVKKDTNFDDVFDDIVSYDVVETGEQSEDDFVDRIKLNDDFNRISQNVRDKLLEIAKKGGTTKNPVEIIDPKLGTLDKQITILQKDIEQLEEQEMKLKITQLKDVIKRLETKVKKTKPKQKRKKTTPRTLNAIKIGRQQGRTFPTIAKRLKRTTSSVYGLYRRHLK